MLNIKPNEHSNGDISVVSDKINEKSIHNEYPDVRTSTEMTNNDNQTSAVTEMGDQMSKLKMRDPSANQLSVCKNDGFVKQGKYY